jgi:hypothetical protein
MNLKRGTCVSDSFVYSKRCSKKGQVPSSSSKITSKKGQVTIFIIIGIVILFVTAGVLYVSQNFLKEKINDQGVLIESVPTAFQSIQTYTENCLYQVGEQGLLILGQQGGYIYPDLIGEFNVPEPTESDGINLEPNKVPYWYYNIELNEANIVTFDSKKPKLTLEDDPALSIEAQLIRFTEEHLNECLRDYESFNEQGFVIEGSGQQKIDVDVTDIGVNFLLTKPLKMSKGPASSDAEQFFVSIQLPLKHYYELASLITDSESEYKYLERQGMELISIYSAKDPNHFAPTSDVDYNLFSALSWNEFGLREKFKSLLTSYVGMLQFMGSQNYRYLVLDDDQIIAQRVVDNMVLPLLGADGIAVNFDYFNWNIFFSTNSQDGVIKPIDTFVNMGPLSFGSQQFETHYDISYPVLISLIEPAALNGKGYSFIFALETNIRNNAPAEGGERPPFYPTPISQLACDKEQKNTGLLKTVVVDSFTKEPIETVRIGFSIPDQTDCEIGITDETGVVEDTYPTVYGGVVNYISEDYLTSFYPIDTYNLKNSSAIIGYAIEALDEKVVEMHKIASVNVTIKKRDIEKCLKPLECKYTTAGYVPGLIDLSILPYKDKSCSAGKEQCFFNQGSLLGLNEPLLSIEANNSLSKYNNYYLSGKISDFSENEEGLVMLQRVRGFHDEVQTSSFFTSINVKGNETVSVNLVPGIYKVSGMSTINQEVHFPTENRCMTYDIISWEEEECFEINESLFDKYVSGNLKWDTEDTYVVIEPEDLYTTKRMVFYLPSQDILSVPETIETPSKECQGYSCIPGVGCAFDACKKKTIPANARIVEDLQVPGLLSGISQKESFREIFKPRYE